MFWDPEGCPTHLSAAVQRASLTCEGVREDVLDTSTRHTCATVS